MNHEPNPENARHSLPQVFVTPVVFSGACILLDEEDFSVKLAAIRAKAILNEETIHLQISLALNAQDKGRMRLNIVPCDERGHSEMLAEDQINATNACSGIMLPRTGFDEQSAMRQFALREPSVAPLHFIVRDLTELMSQIAQRLAFDHALTWHPSTLPIA